MFFSASGSAEARLHLHHDVILVERRINGGNLALAEGVVERVVDRLRRDAQARGGVAVDDELEPASPGSAGRCSRPRSSRQRPHLRQQLGRPLVQIARGLSHCKRVLILRVARRPPTRMSCAACRNSVAPGNARQLWPQPVDHLVGADLALARAASATMNMRAGVRRAAVPPVKRDDVLHRRIVLHDVRRTACSFCCIA